jgi:hypothetical protein
VLLGIVLLFSDRTLLNHFDWSQTDAPSTVVQYRHTVILVQLLLVAIAYVKMQRVSLEKRTATIMLVATLTGFAFSGIGWERIDSLLRFQSMLGC